MTLFRGDSILGNKTAHENDEDCNLNTNLQYTETRIHHNLALGILQVYTTPCRFELPFLRCMCVIIA